MGKWTSIALAALLLAGCAKEVPAPGELRMELEQRFPNNRPILIVAFGHSVPAGYFKTPSVHTFESYPHLFHRALADKYPNAVINVIVTAKANEVSTEGARRFQRDVLAYHPDLVTIDYGLNDVRAGLPPSRKAWAAMIEQAQAQGVRVILLTPSLRHGGHPDRLAKHAAQIRELGREYNVPVADSYAAFQRHGDFSDLLSTENHPNRAGHELIARELMHAAGIVHQDQAIAGN